MRKLLLNTKGTIYGNTVDLTAPSLSPRDEVHKPNSKPQPGTKLRRDRLDDLGFLRRGRVVSSRNVAALSVLNVLLDGSRHLLVVLLVLEDLNILSARDTLGQHLLEREDVRKASSSRVRPLVSGYRE